MLILRVVSKAIFPIFLLYTIYLLARGHQQIGGGFIAGVMLGLTMAALYIGISREFAKKCFGVKGYHVLAIGLLVAIITGIAAFFFGLPFLTSGFREFNIFFFGHVELASAAIFDFGIFITVFGVLLVIIDTLGQSIEGED